VILAQNAELRLDANWVDYLLIATYFAFVLGIGILARRSVSSSLDFFLSGRSLPAWVTGMAFISANLGAVEIIGMSANGANYGIPTVHYFWIGAVPAMLFLGVVMMPFRYGPKFARSGVHAAALRSCSTPGQRAQLRARPAAHRRHQPVPACEPPRGVARLAALLSLIVAAAIVLTYTPLGRLSAAVYNEVLQFFIIVAAGRRRC
jgi:solute:Na+ symporter, SSS family